MTVNRTIVLPLKPQKTKDITQSVICRFIKSELLVSYSSIFLSRIQQKAIMLFISIMIFYNQPSYQLKISFTFLKKITILIKHQNKTFSIIKDIYINLYYQKPTA